MSVYRDIKNSRRLVWAGIVVGYALAGAIAGLNLTSGDGTVLTAAAFLAVLAIPPTLALMSLDRRPSLLAVAAMTAVFQGVILLTSLGLISIVSAILWFLASRLRPREAARPAGSAWMRPLLAVASLIPLLVMFVHLDPTCTVTTEDGTVVRTYEDEGAAAGWGFQLGSSGSESTSGGETTTCVTNRVVVWEATASIALSALFLVLVLVYWPTSETLLETRPNDLSDHPA